MEAKTKVLVTRVDEKISNSGTKYFQIDLTEDTKIPNSLGGTFKRVWEKCYMPFTAGMENPKMLENHECDVEMNFYPQGRTVGDKTFTDIKCNIIRFS